jgi:hypothetical protein
VPTKPFRSSARRTNHFYECGRKRPQQIARVGLGAEPARVLRDRDDGRHAVVDRPDQFVGGDGDDAERPLPIAILIAPVLPDTGFRRREIRSGAERERAELAAVEKLNLAGGVHDFHPLIDIRFTPGSGHCAASRYRSLWANSDTN